MSKTIYYRFTDSPLIGKCADENKFYLFHKESGWTEDTKNLINDTLHGYDPSEPEDSSFGFGESEIENEIEEISEQEEMDIIKSL